MKEFIGIKVKFIADGHSFEGEVIQDRPDRVLVKGADGKVVRLIKSRVTMFVPEKEPEAFIPIQLLYCRNPATQCPGVQYTIEGESTNPRMFDAFMKNCLLRRGDCKCGTQGDLRTVSSSCLKGLLSGVLFGDYPDPESKRGKGEGK